MLSCLHGGMAERSKAVVLKTIVPETAPGVRIPLPPLLSLSLHCSFGKDSNRRRISPGFSRCFPRPRPVGAGRTGEGCVVLPRNRDLSPTRLPAAAPSSCSTSCTKPAASLAVSMACRSRPTSSASLSLIRSPVPVRSTILWTLATSGAAGPTTGTTATSSGVGCIFLAVLIPTFRACQPSLIVPARCCIAPKMASAVFSGIPAVSAASFEIATARSSLPAIAANNSSISCSWKPALRPVW